MSDGHQMSDEELAFIENLLEKINQSYRQAPGKFFCERLPDEDYFDELVRRTVPSPESLRERMTI